MQTSFPYPSHVPAELVRTFSLYDDPKIVADPFRALSELHDGPRLFWNTINPRHGGSWIVTRAEDARHVLDSPDLFSVKGQFNMAPLIGESWDMVPGELDPPDLRKYRSIIMQWVNLPAVNAMGDKVRERCVTLMERLAGKTECEFMGAFGIPFPVSIFIDLMGLPQAEADMFLQWELDIVRQTNMKIRGDAIRAIADYLRTCIAERRKRPTDDLISRAIAAQVDGEPLDDNKIMGICFMLFTGGLDTVASSIGFQFRYLAEHPELQERMKAQPELVPRIVEELLRAFSVVVLHRVAVKDTEIAGVHIAKGDWIAVPTALASTDPLDARGAAGIDPDRRVVRHLAFGVGGHACLGMHLARRELNVALEEWGKRMPIFEIPSGKIPTFKGGGVFLVDELPLRWG